MFAHNVVLVTVDFSCQKYSSLYVYLVVMTSVMSSDMLSYMFNLCYEAILGTNGITSDVTI